MKYIFLIVRHFFPRRRWVVVSTTEVGPQYSDDVTGKVILLRDQFGNMRTQRIQY